MAKNIQLALRMTEETRNAIEQAAADDNRTMAGWMERVLVAELKAKGYLTPKPTPPSRARKPT